MTNQEALDILVNAKFCKSNEHEKIVNEAIETLQELVDKQKPKEVTNVSIQFDDSYSIGTCPTCKEIVALDLFGDKINYCQYCGQKLDWS